MPKPKEQTHSRTRNRRRHISDLWGISYIKARYRTHPLDTPIQMLSQSEEVAADLKAATAGFDLIFSNELDKAEDLFKTSDSAFHLLGSGACAFLQAAVSLEVRVPSSIVAYPLPTSVPVSGWSHRRSFEPPRSGRGRRKETSQELKGPQTDRPFPRIHRVGAHILRLCHSPGLDPGIKVCTCGARALLETQTLTSMTASLTWDIYSVCECFVSDCFRFVVT